MAIAGHKALQSVSRCADGTVPIAASPKWQRLGSYERFADMIDRHWDGIAAYCKPESNVSLGFVEGLNNKIRVLQRRAYGLRDEEYLRLKILTCMLPPLRSPMHFPRYDPPKRTTRFCEDAKIALCVPAAVIVLRHTNEIAWRCAYSVDRGVKRVHTHRAGNTIVE